MNENLVIETVLCLHFPGVYTFFGIIKQRRGGGNKDKVGEISEHNWDYENKVENSEIERIIKEWEKIYPSVRKLLKWEEKSMTECGFIEKIKSRDKKNKLNEGKNLFGSGRVMFANHQNEKSPPCCNIPKILDFT